jgi:hypothetical protein
LLHCVVTSAHKTYQSVWKSWCRVVDIFNSMYSAWTYIRYHPYNHCDYNVILVQWCSVNYPHSLSGKPARNSQTTRTEQGSFPNLGRHQNRSRPMWLGRVLQEIRAHQHPESDSINVLFTTMLDQHTSQLLQTGYILIHDKYVIRMH